MRDFHEQWGRVGNEMRIRRGAVPVAFAVVGMGLAAAPANAVVSTIYVQSGTGCSDSGVGSSSKPFCTIGKAASVVQPGQTVMVGGGSYPETVTISAKGTATAPIRFVGQSTPTFQLATWVGSNGGTTSGDHAFVLNGAQYVTITGMALSGNKEAVLTENSQNVTLDSLETVNQQGSVADVHVSGSSNVTISRSTLEYGVNVDSSSTGTTISANVLEGSPLDGAGGLFAAVRVTGATGTTVESNTINPMFCADGIALTAASTGAVISNNIVDTTGNPGVGCTGQTGVVVDQTSATGTTSDYNVVYTGGGAPFYSWNGSTYSDLALFHTATGQGAHDLGSDPKLVVPQNVFQVSNVAYYPSEGSPEVDSGDAAHAAATDLVGNPRVDDPLVANTGTGVGYVDRGAYEYQDPIAMLPITVKHTAGGGPLDNDVTAGVSAAWSNQITYTYNFQDGSPAKTVTSGLTDTVTHDFAIAGDEFVVVSANDGFASTSQNDQNSYFSFTLGADYTPMNPTRMLDTRNAIGVSTTTPVPANSDITLNVGGVDGIPTTGLSAVVMNVTVTQPTAGGYLTVYPHGIGTPDASSLNFSAGETVPNLVTTMVTDGKVDFHNGSGGTVHVIADVEGYYADSGSGYKAVAPTRVLDTRQPIGVPVKAPIPANGQLALDLSSKVPTGTTAVTMNVTVTRPAAGGYLTVFPGGTTAPLASNLNFYRGETVPNLVTVPVKNGVVDFKNGSPGPVDVVADLAGYYGDASTGATTGLAPNMPFRIWDTRFFGQKPQPVGPGSFLSVGIDNFMINGSAKPVSAIMNVTVTGPTAGGYLTVYPDGSVRPTASNLNFVAGETVPNLVSSTLGPNGVFFYNGSAGTTNVVVDLDGLFVQPLS